MSFPIFFKDLVRLMAGLLLPGCLTLSLLHADEQPRGDKKVSSGRVAANGVAWGEATNGLRAGLSIDLPGGRTDCELGKAVGFDAWLQNTNSTAATVHVPVEIEWTAEGDRDHVAVKPQRKSTGNVVLKLDGGKIIRFPWRKGYLVFQGQDWQGDRNDYACAVIPVQADKITVSSPDLLAVGHKLSTGETPVKMNLNAASADVKPGTEQRISWGTKVKELQAGAVVMEDPSLLYDGQIDVLVEIFLRNSSKQEVTLNYILPGFSWGIFDASKLGKVQPHEGFLHPGSFPVQKVTLRPGERIHFKGPVINSGVASVPGRGFIAGLVDVPEGTGLYDVLLSTGLVTFAPTDPRISK